MLLWDRCLVLLTCGIIVCKRLPKRCGRVGVVAVWESNHMWCSICVQRFSGLCPTRLFVILSALCTFACIALNISVLWRVDKPALCVHYCLHAACIMIVVCTACTMLVARRFLPVCADVFNGCVTRDVRHRGSVFSVGVTDFSLSLCVLHAMPPR